MTMRAGSALRLCAAIALALTFVLAWAAGEDGGAGTVARAQALEGLRAADVEVRRKSSLGLGASGEMDDVPALIESLRDDDELVRAIAQRSIWAIWSRSGDAQTDLLFEQGAEEMANGNLKAAVVTFTRIIERAPAFAEGWNKRATALFLLGELDASARDCDEVLALNPLHFGALSGYGLIETRRGRLENALAYFQRALALNPNLVGVSDNVESVRRALAKRRMQDT